MNREQRRIMEKEDKKQQKQQEKCKKRLINKLYNLYVKPCCYINSSPVNIGDVIFLKKTNNLGCYDATLKKLVDENHRFVIVYSLYPRTDTIVVCLLSTSKLANQQYRNGIRLTGKYNEYKDVYMDINNYYVIETKYIDSVAYTLSYYDMSNCTSCYARTSLGENNLIKGNNFSDKVNNTFESYNQWITKYHSENTISTLDSVDIHYYVINLPINEVDKKLKQYEQENTKRYMMCEYVAKKQNLDRLYTDRGFCKQEAERRALLTAILFSTNDEYHIQSNNLIRNYN